MKLFISQENKPTLLRYSGVEWEFACSDLWRGGCGCNHSWAQVAEVDLSALVDAELYAEGRFFNGDQPWHRDWLEPESIQFDLQLIAGNLALAQDFEVGAIVLVEDLLNGDEYAAALDCIAPETLQQAA